MTTSYIDERFLSEYLEEAPEPVPFETFEAAFEHGKEPSDPWLAPSPGPDYVLNGRVSGRECGIPRFHAH